MRAGCLQRGKVRKEKAGRRVPERIARMIGTTSGWLEVASALTGKARFPEKEWRWPELQSSEAFLGEQVGPGSLSGPAYLWGLKILLFEKDKGKANHRQCDF